MLSIEETWKDLEAQAVVLAWAIPRVRKPDRTLDAARALALAGFELGGLRTCNSSACGSVQPDGSTWRCRYCAGRARIEALGK